ncbi:hypothetical protein BC835DRAFT_1422542 [Cytidiella melzeri]|nr:hypothetical protein BC835DRAFT_1422542 [Cytidiella melzeri]
MATVLMVNAGPHQHGEEVDNFHRVSLWIKIHGLSRALDSVPLVTKTKLDATKRDTMWKTTKRW